MPAPKKAFKPLPQQLAEVAADMSRQNSEALQTSSVLSPEQIHHLRTSVKRLRARWHLFRSGIGKMAAREADRNLRDANREFSGARDAQVQLALLDELARNGTGKGRPNQAVLRLRGALAAAMPELTQRLELSGSKREELIQRFRDDAKRWSQATEVAPGTLVDGMTRVFKRSQNLAHKAYQKDTPEAFHEWRRWCKYLYYQLEALTEVQPRWQKERVSLWKELGSRLGHRHDLSILFDLLERKDPPWKSRDLEITRKRAQGRDERLGKRIRVLYGTLYGESPKKFRLRVAMRMLS
ncbi:MAG: CHAD domain-containing protein [Verrucomicrobiota bacterium]